MHSVMQQLPTRAGPEGAHTPSNPDLPLVSTAVRSCSSFLLLHHILELFFRGIPEAAAGSFTQRLPLNRIHQTPLELGANYVRLVTAFENTPLIAVASALSEATAAKDSRTRRSAYSVKSWPSCSFHKRIIRFFIWCFLSVDLRAKRCREVPLCRYSLHLERHSRAILKTCM